eukprot:TRINITY_DN95641_c0_g1_i1.p1 TRINITY_DN95641_c0_g1~~TRINITY_DN95641_c0_g1_i1.p1  ORF type:complete len:437 (-),score=102.64 TRINITY_DN95641_c0_g1_i1:8-1255(-)
MARVKNTFITVDESPKRTDRRHRTEPGLKGGVGRDLFAACFACESDEDSDSEDTYETALGRPRPALQTMKTFDPFDDQPGEASRAANGVSPLPPQQARAKPALQQMKTFDQFELGELASSPVARPQVATSQAVPALTQPAQGQPMQVTVVPAQMQSSAVAMPGGQMQMVQMPSGMMGMAAMPQGMPQGMPIAMPSGVVAGGGVMLMPVNVPVMVPAGSTSNTDTASPSDDRPAFGKALSERTRIKLESAIMKSPGKVPIPAQAPITAKAPLAPNSIQSTTDDDGTVQVQWAVDARRLVANDKTVVSPAFEMPSKLLGVFKIMLSASSSALKGGATFRNSSGKGAISLKCENADGSQSKASISFAAGDSRRTLRGPVEHDFTQIGVCTLPQDQQEWDFNKAVDHASRTFLVTLRIA